MRTHLGFPSPEEVERVDPSEAIHSAEIVDAVNRHFDVVEFNFTGGDLSPIFRTMTTMRFPVNLTGWRSRYEEAVHRRTNH